VSARSGAPRAATSAMIALLAVACSPWEDFATRDPALEPPRPTSPPSGARLTGSRPLFRWALAPGTDGAIVEICADRSCEEVLLRFAAEGSAALPPIDLRAGVSFWRLRARSADTIGERTSPVWSTFAPTASEARSGPTAWHGSVLDLDGDGFADLAIPAPGIGRVFVHRGGPDRIPIEIASLDLPIASDDEIGLDAASAGDVDGDGFVDLVVAARSDCLTPQARGGPPGVVYVFRGRPDGPESAPSHTLTVTDAAACFGHTAIGADLDGDGLSEIVVSMRDADRVRIYPGSPSGPIDAPIDRIESDAAEVGRSLSVGDLDADGFTDVVVEAYGRDTGALAITALVLRGGPSGPATSYEPVSAPASFSTAPDDRAAIIGDVDGDGLPDLALADATTVAVFASSLDPAAPLLLASEGTAALRALGDVDGDGIDDFATGAPRLGRVSIWFGGEVGATLDHVELLWGGGPAESHAFGATVGGPGDVDRDGLADVLVGAPHALGPSRTVLAGHAYLYLGTRDRSVGEPWRFRGPDQESSWFGSGLGY
jgi:hypothetical protein